VRTIEGVFSCEIVDIAGLSSHRPCEARLQWSCIEDRYNPADLGDRAGLEER